MSVEQNNTLNAIFSNNNEISYNRASNDQYVL